MEEKGKKDHDAVRAEERQENAERYFGLEWRAGERSASDATIVSKRGMRLATENGVSSHALY